MLFTLRQFSHEHFREEVTSSIPQTEHGGEWQLLTVRLTASQALPPEQASSLLGVSNGNNTKLLKLFLRHGKFLNQH